MASPANIIKGGKGTFTEDHRAVFPAYFYVWIFKPVGNKIFKVVFHENDSTTKLKRQGGVFVTAALFLNITAIRGIVYQIRTLLRDFVSNIKI